MISNVIPGSVYSLTLLPIPLGIYATPAVPLPGSNLFPVSAKIQPHHFLKRQLFV